MRLAQNSDEVDAALRLRERVFAVEQGVRPEADRDGRDPDATHVVAVEDVFYSRNVRTTVVLGHARGVVLLAAEQAGVEIHEYPPAEIKKAVVGTGSATKEQVQFMVTRLLRLRTVPSPADASDAVAAALSHIMSARIPKVAPIKPLKGRL